LYETDAVMADHTQRSTPSTHRLLHEFLAMDMDDRWVTRSPADMLETFHWFSGECFEFIVEDLQARSQDRLVVAEGFRLLPGLVEPLLGDHGAAVWLLPSPGFRRGAFESRGSLSAIAGRTGAPARAVSNLLERDALFTEQLRGETRRLALAVIEVNEGVSEDDLANAVATALGLDD
jgi:hypothetical protein